MRIKTIGIAAALTVGIACLGLLGAGAAGAAEIKVLSAGGFKEAYVELVPQFEKASEHKVATTWSGVADIQKRIAAGDVYDVVVSSGPAIDNFIKQGKIVPGSRVDLAKSGVGVAVKQGAPKPDIGTTEALKKALLTARSIGISTGPSGVYLVSLFERLGVANEIKGKLRQTPSGVAVGGIIANGEVELGFQQVSEFVRYPGVDYVGPLPPDIQIITAFSSGIHASAPQPDAGRALVKFLTAPAALPVIKKNGMEPG